MTFGPPSQAPRLPPGLVEAATRHAHALRAQALDDALGALASRLRRLIAKPGSRTAQEQPCLS